MLLSFNLAIIMVAAIVATSRSISVGNAFYITIRMGVCLVMVQVPWSLEVRFAMWQLPSGAKLPLIPRKRHHRLLDLFAFFLYSVYVVDLYTFGSLSREIANCFIFIERWMGTISGSSYTKMELVPKCVVV